MTGAIFFSTRPPFSNPAGRELLGAEYKNEADSCGRSGDMRWLVR